MSNPSITDQIAISSLFFDPICLMDITEVTPSRTHPDLINDDSVEIELLIRDHKDWLNEDGEYMIHLYLELDAVDKLIEQLQKIRRRSSVADRIADCFSGLHSGHCPRNDCKTNKCEHRQSDPCRNIDSCESCPCIKPMGVRFSE